MVDVLHEMRLTILPGASIPLNYLVGDEEFEFAIQANFGRSAVPASRSRYLMAPNNSV
jgi:hypothetical protein